MRQLVHRLRDGRMRVVDVPAPAPGRGRVLVRSHCSLISAGTERSTVAAARKGLIGKARERPRQVRQVIETARAQGPAAAYRAVRKRLDALSPLGYSVAGEVAEVGAGVEGFAVGDRVACGGAGHAVHAELVSVPANLCVKLAPDADPHPAAYNTVGAIALQGIRQADLRLGEAAGVIGLGLVGQLTCLMLRASGVRVMGLDLDPRMVAMAAEHAGVELALDAAAPEVVPAALRMSGGLGLDAVIITAATPSHEPVNLAGRLLRRRATVVVVGDVPTGFEREPDYYRKELGLKMSCAYGPGRYDAGYEEHGLDYPAGYVRWTENRNMQAFQALLRDRAIDVGYLTTHRFALEDAPKAYDLLLEGAEPHVGIVIDYPRPARPEPARIEVRAPARRPAPGGAVRISLIGAGSYACGHLLPALAGMGDVALRGVASASGTSSRGAAERFGFEFASADAGEILADRATDAVVVATRHDSHADYVVAALEAGKHVLVEKPLCLRPEDLARIEALVAREGSPLLLVGFNRRFSPFARRLRSLVGAEPVAMTYRVNAGRLPEDSWIRDPRIGGGRIVGEVCHFVDLCTYLCGSPPRDVHAAALAEPGESLESVSLSVRHRDGSLAVITYLANGAAGLGKEHLELHHAGTSAVLRDFRRLVVHGGRGRGTGRRALNPDKGQAAMLRAFVEAVRAGGPSPVDFAEIRAVTAATFAALESLGRARPVPVDEIGAGRPAERDLPADGR